MNVLSLLLDSPLWMAVLAITVGLHVGFVVVVRRLMRAPPDDPKPPPPSPPTS